jgi:hypothetical protein
MWVRFYFLQNLFNETISMHTVFLSFVKQYIWVSSFCCNYVVPFVQPVRYFHCRGIVQFSCPINFWWTLSFIFQILAIINEILFLLLLILGFELQASCLDRTIPLEPFLPAFLSVGCFPNGIWWTICLGWHQTVTLMMSASWVPRITGMSHQCPAWT